MAGKIQGITIKLLGDSSDLKRSLNEVDNVSKDLNSELKNINTSLKFNPGNADIISQKQRVLAESVENTKKKLETLKQVQLETEKTLGVNPNAQREYDAISREILKTENQLKDLSSELDKSDSSWQRNAESVEKAGNKIKEVGGKVTEAGKDLSMKVTAPLVAAGAASFMLAADLQDAMGATDQIFKNSSGEMKKWADGLDSYYGIAEGEALGYANTMGAMLQNIGGKSEEEAAKQAQILVELAGDLSAMFGGSTESAVQALTGALKGNTSMLDNYGMGVNEATIKQKAFEMGLIETGVSAEETEKLTLGIEKAQNAYNKALDKYGPSSLEARDASNKLDLAKKNLADAALKSEGSMSLEAKQAATLALIMEQTGAAQGQAAREADGASGSTKSLATDIKNLSSDIGEILIPIITPLIQGLRDLVESFKNLSPEQQEMIVKIGLIVAAVGPLLVIIGTLISSIGAIVGAIGAFMSLAVAPAILIIGALIAVGVLLWKNWDTVKAKATELWNNLIQIFEAIKAGVSEKIQALRDWLSSAWDSIKDTASRVWISIKDSIIKPIQDAWNRVNQVVTDIKNAISDKFNAAKATVDSVFGAIGKKIDDVISGARRVVENGINFIKGLFNFSWELPRIKLPHFSVSGDFGLNPLRIPTFGISWYDKGGIFTRPSVIGVGEKRPEFVGALDDLKAIVRAVIEENPLQQSGVVITGNSFVIRQESDIRKVAEELYRLEAKKRRGGI